MNLTRIAVMLGACGLLLSACAGQKTEADTTAAPVGTPVPASQSENPAVTEVIWPREEYASLDEEGRAAYRQTVEAQLAPGEYVLLPDGSVAENPETGRYDPQTFLETFPEASLPRQQVEDYTLEQVQVGFRVDPAAQRGDNTVRRYQVTSEALQGVTLVYRSGKNHMNLCLIGLRTWPEAGADYTFGQQAVAVAEEDGRRVYSLSGTLDGSTLVQLNGTAESEEAFAAAAAAFAEAAPDLLAVTT